MAVLVLPDQPLPIYLQQRLIKVQMPLLASHASGRPWLRGNFGHDKTLHVSNRGISLVVVNHAASDEDVFRRAIVNKTSVDQIDDLPRLINGRSLLLASAGGFTRSQGSVSSSKAIFRTTTSGVTLASDSQHLLAQIIGETVDATELVVRLSSGEASFPLSTGVIWDGVTLVPSGTWLRTEGNGESTEVPWWNPPDPTGDLPCLTPPLKRSIRSALKDRLAYKQTVSADLSGGLDSTSLCFFTQQFRPDLQTFFLESENAANRDVAWSRRAAKELQSVHRILKYQPDLGPAVVSDSELVQSLPEGPSQAARYVKVAATLSGMMPPGGSSIHISGHGGDELFGPVGAMPWSLIRSSYSNKYRHIWNLYKVNRHKLVSTLRLLTSSGSPQADLLAIAASTLDLYPDDNEHDARWVPPISLPRFMTSTAKELMRDHLRSLAARSDLMLHHERTSHQIMQGVIFHGTLVRRMNLMVRSDQDLVFDSPFLDRRVVEIAMSLNIGDRSVGTVAKPLLASSRPTAMSLDYFKRKDKGEYSAETFAEYRHERERIRASLQDGCYLHELGLVDLDKLLTQIDQFSSDGALFEEVLQFDLVERWLRAADRPVAGMETQGKGPY